MIFHKTSTDFFILGRSFFDGAEQAKDNTAKRSIAPSVSGVFSILGSKMSIRFPSTKFLYTYKTIKSGVNFFSGTDTNQFA